jgi:hypothetical protein
VTGVGKIWLERLTWRTGLYTRLTRQVASSICEVEHQILCYRYMRDEDSQLQNWSLFGFELRLSYYLYSEHRMSMSPMLQRVSHAFTIHTLIIHAIVNGALKLCSCKFVFASAFSRRHLLQARATLTASHRPTLPADRSSLIDIVVSTATSAPLVKRMRGLVLLASALADSWMGWSVLPEWVDSFVGHSHLEKLVDFLLVTLCDRVGG